MGQLPADVEEDLPFDREFNDWLYSRDDLPTIFLVEERLELQTLDRVLSSMEFRKFNALEAMLEERGFSDMIPVIEKAREGNALESMKAYFELAQQYSDLFVDIIVASECLKNASILYERLVEAAPDDKEILSYGARIKELKDELPGVNSHYVDPTHLFPHFDVFFESIN